MITMVTLIKLLKRALNLLKITKLIVEKNRFHRNNENIFDIEKGVFNSLLMVDTNGPEQCTKDADLLVKKSVEI